MENLRLKIFSFQFSIFNLFFFLSFAFLSVNAIFIYNEIYWFNLLPLALVVIAFAFLSLEKLLLFIVFFTPLSVNLEQLEFGLGMALPTEPLMFGAMLIFFLRTFYEKDFDIKILKHPITIAIIVNLVWVALTVFTSKLQVVSFKHFVAKMWFVVCFYFIATQIFREQKNILRFFWLYIIPLALVVIYTMFQHAQHNFEEKPAHWVMQPFFKDHTSYGAILAMFFPFIIGSFFSKKINGLKKVFSILLFSIITIGLVFSYTRAAWISIIIALGIFFIYFFRIRFHTIAIGFTLLLTLFLFFQNDIFNSLEKNKQESSSDFAQHAQSVTNIASDASNLERLNRWNCALRMFAENPVFGTGPGTYQFLYSPYQHSSELTIISTKFGDAGNAHSEYLGPLAESGIFGALTFLALIICMYVSASKLYFRLKERELKIIVLTTILGFSTYVIHGILNNFLDTDKASVPFWGFIAVIVAVEIYHQKQEYPDKNLSVKQP